MAKKKKNKSYKQKLADINKQVGGSTPSGIQYHALKGMGYTPETRDLHKRARKQAKQDLRNHDYEI